MVSRRSCLPVAVELLSVLVVLGLVDNRGHAAVVGMATENANSSYTYSFTVDNTSGTFDIFSWSIEFDIPAISLDWNRSDTGLGGDVSVPFDWTASAGIPVSDQSAQEFLSFGLMDVLAGQSLSGFSFTSFYQPGFLDYYEFGTLGESAEGTVIGPSSALSPYWFWLEGYFSIEDLNDETKESTVWGIQADGDADGWPNGVEFYLGMNPLVFDEPRFEATTTGNVYTVSLDKNVNAPMDWAHIEYSFDMKGWGNEGMSREVVGAPSNGRELVEATLTAADITRIFFRVSRRLE